MVDGELSLIEMPVAAVNIGLTVAAAFSRPRPPLSCLATINVAAIFNDAAGLTRYWATALVSLEQSA